MYNLKDNIAALATTPGASALNIVRVSGSSEVDSVFKKLTKKTTLPRPNTCYPYIIYNKNKKIDQVIISYYSSPKSYTGQHMLEISVHGGGVVADQIMSILLSYGCRVAGPGEFTYRAFVNNKIDLIQAEAINGIINAKSQKASQYQINNLVGGVSNKLLKYQKKIKNFLLLIEQELDFSEEEIEENITKDLLDDIEKLNNEIKKTIKNACYEINVELPRIVIIGSPNAGKSSLFNKIVGYDKAIVTNIKGTTRDVLEANIKINNRDVCLIDTAGLRSTKNKIEALGIEKTKKEIKNAALVFVLSEKNPFKLKEKFCVLNREAEWVCITNKIDINKKNPLSQFNLSCKNNEGINELLTWISTKVNSMYDKKYSNKKYLLNDRQGIILNNITKKISLSIKKYPSHQDLAIFCVEIRGVLDLFSDLIRPIDNNDIINQIFGDFCVGK